jgi:hypothetical protein
MDQLGNLRLVGRMASVCAFVVEKLTYSVLDVEPSVSDSMVLCAPIYI